MSSKFLGKGLAELNEEMGQLPDISILTGSQRVVVKQIPLAQISPNPNQPRKTFNQKELDELANSIREKGVFQPIILRTVKNKPYLYEIVAGERRFRASQSLGLTEIPALVKELDDKIKIIIDELSSKSSYESNLMSFLNNETKLMSYTLDNNEAQEIIKVINDYSYAFDILDDYDHKRI